MDTLRTLYHFTGRVHLDSILADGVLRTTNSNLADPPMGQGVVWALDTETVDHYHGLGDGSPIEGYVIDGQPVYSTDKRNIRVGMRVRDAAPWLTWLETQPHDPRWVRAIIETGGGYGAAEHWYVIPRPVHCFDWSEVRDMTTDQVVDLEPSRRSMAARVNPRSVAGGTARGRGGSHG